MSLAKSDVIDLVALMPDRQTVALIAFDDGELPDGDSRERALEKKLIAYLQFVTSGQFIELHPEHADHGVKITVVCFSPPSEAIKRIEQIREHDKPETFLPVEVVSDADFRAGLRQHAPKPKPWWRLWS
jgi:hypothetical protein